MSDSLERLIEEAASAARKQSLRGAAVAAAHMPAMAETMSFCQYWPAVRPVLVTLQGLLPAVSFLIAIILAVGDKACPKT